MGTGRGRPTRGSGYGDEDGDDGHKKKGRGHKDRQKARRRRDKKQHQDDAWYAKFDDQKVPLHNRNIADGLGITLDRLSKLGRTGKFKNVACEVNPEGTYFTKGLADERDHAVDNFYDSFPKFSPVPDNWKKRVVMQLLRQSRARRLRRTGGSASRS
jgi:hypothetical protein